jgi:hypothetical protein
VPASVCPTCAAVRRCWPGWRSTPSTGGCVGPLLLIYFNRVAGIPLGRAGTILTLASIVSIAVPAVVGHVIDQFGAPTLATGTAGSGSAGCCRQPGSASAR